MRNKLLFALLLITAIVAPHRSSAQGFIGNGTGNGIVGVASTGTSNAVNVGIGTAAPSVTLEVYAPSNLGLKFDNLPLVSDSDILYYNPSNGIVTYGPLPSASVSSVNFDCGIGTVTVNGASSAQRAWLLSGSTTVDSTNYFGTYNNDDIRVATNNASCQLNALKEKMIIGSDANSGNVEIGWDGINALPVPSASNFSKFLVQNGSVVSNPLAGISGLPISGNDIGIYSFSNNKTTGSNNVGVASVITAARPFQVGYLAQVSNGTTVNTGVVANISSLSSSPPSNNFGFNATVIGDNTNNYGAQFNVDGNNGNNVGTDVEVGFLPSVTNLTNTGALVNVTGSSYQNYGVNSTVVAQSNNINVGVNGAASGCTWTNYSSPQGNIGIIGSATSGTGVANTVNTGVKGDASGNGSYNSCFLGSATGNTNSLNVGTDVYAAGDNNNSWGLITDERTWKANVGYYSAVQGQNSTNIGGISRVTDFSGSDDNGSEVYGLIGSSIVSNSSTCTSQVGIWGYIANAPSTSVANYAIKGTAPNGGAGGGVFSPTLGSSTVAPSYAGYFEGDVFCSNTYYYSDPKLKENITDFNGAIDLINQLSIKRYNFKNKEYPYMNLPQGEQVGVISTDLKQVCPGLVKPAVHMPIGKGDQQISFEAVNYNALIPVLIQAVKELNAKTDSVTTNNTLTNTIATQQAQIADLNKQLVELKNMIADICNTGCGALQNSIGSAGTGSAVLYQSSPNPTSGSAMIGYSISIPFSSATIQVSDNAGKLISKFILPHQQGAGSVTFDGSSAVEGTYTYSLIVDSKVYDSKSMVIVGNK